MNFFLCSILLIFFSVGCESVVVDCKYIQYFGYSCVAQNSQIITSYDRYISGARGQHLSGYSNDNVNCFYSNGKQVDYVPKGLKSVFRNLDTIEINTATLKELSNNELFEYGASLKNFWLSSDTVEVVRKDLFIYNPNIQWLMSGTNFKFVEDGAFNGVSRFKSVTFSSNTCGGSTPIASYETASNCKYSTYGTTTTPRSNTTTITTPTTTTTTQNPMIVTLNDEISTLNSNLTSNLLALDAKNEEIKKLKEEVNAKITEENLKEMLELILAKLSSLESQMSEQKSTFETLLNQQKNDILRIEEKLNPETSNCYEIEKKINSNIAGESKKLLSEIRGDLKLSREGQEKILTLKLDKFTKSVNNMGNRVTHAEEELAIMIKEYCGK